MDKQQLREWQRHPVSKILVDLLTEHRDAIKELIANSDFEVNTIGANNRLKGQLNTLEMLLDLDGFFAEKIIRERAVEDEQQET